MLTKRHENIIHRVLRNSLDKQFVSPEVAEKLFKFTFDDMCLGYYDFNNILPNFISVGIRGISNVDWSDKQREKGITGYSAPLIQQVVDWLEDLHKIRLTTTVTEHGTVKYVIFRWEYNNKVGKWERISNVASYNSIFEAWNAGILATLELPEKEYQVSKIKDTGEEYFETIITGFKKEK